jgi:hypothetical protein
MCDPTVSVPRPLSPKNSITSISVPPAGTPSTYLVPCGSNQKPECIPLACWGLMRAATMPWRNERVCSVATWLLRRYGLVPELRGWVYAHGRPARAGSRATPRCSTPPSTRRAAGSTRAQVRGAYTLSCSRFWSFQTVRSRSVPEKVSSKAGAQRFVVTVPVAQVRPREVVLAR